MKKILLIGVATSILLAGVAAGTVANAGEFSGNTTIWVWNVNVFPAKAAAKMFMKEHPQAHVKIVQVGHDPLYQKLSSGLLAHGRGLPDATLMEDDTFDSYVKIYPHSFVNVGKMGFDKLSNLFVKYKADSFMYKNHMYGFPLDAGPAVIFYRRSVFAKAGVKPSDIKTWGDYLKYGKIIKAKTGKFMFGGSDDDGIYRVMLGQYGKSYYDTKGNIDIKSPRSTQVLQRIRNMFKAGILHHRGPGWDAWMRDLKQGNVVAVPSGVWLQGSLQSAMPELKGDWGIFPLPTKGDGDIATASLGGSGFVMLSNSKNKPLTYNFLKYYTTQDKTQLLALNAGLFPTLKSVYKTPEFNKGVPFFKNQKIYAQAAKFMHLMKAVNFTDDFYYGKKEMSKLFSGVLFTNGDLLKRLDQAAASLKARTGRKINKY